jgi:hypothetical protein
MMRSSAHATVIDGISDAPLMDATIVVVNGHIQSVGRGGVAATCTAVIEGNGEIASGENWASAMLHVGGPAEAHDEEHRLALALLIPIDFSCRGSRSGTSRDPQKAAGHSRAWILSWDNLKVAYT